MKKLPFYLLCTAMLATASVVSCVKNDESASVTNLRDAKTMQLKSVAELNTAQAQAELIRANAEKAFKEAEAAYQNALAAVQNAQAAEKQVAVDKAKATLAADIQVALQRAETELFTAKNAYNAAWKTYEEFRAENSNPYLDKLMVQYKTYNADYGTASTAWTTAKSQLLALKTGLITAQEAQATAIAGFNNTIAENEALLAVYNTLPAGDKMAAKQALEASKAKMASLKVGQKAVADPVNVAFKAIKEGQIALNGQVAPAVKGGAYYEAAKQATVTAPFVKYDKTDGSNTVTVSTYVTTTPIAYNGLTPITIGVDGDGLPTYTPASAVTITVSTAEVDEVALAVAVNAAEAAAKATQTAYDDKVKAQKTASGDKTYEQLVAAAETAKQAYLNALATGVAADIATQKTAYDEAEAKVTDWDTAVKTEFDANAAEQAKVKALKEWQAIVTLKANVEQYHAQLNAVTAAKAAYDEAIAAFAKINDPITIETAIQTDLQAIYNGTVDAPALVAATKKKLDEAKAELAEVANGANGTFSKEQAIAVQERTIANAELELKEIQLLIDQVKTKIDAELKK